MQATAFMELSPPCAPPVSPLPSVLFCRHLRSGHLDLDPPAPLPQVKRSSLTYCIPMCGLLRPLCVGYHGDTLGAWPVGCRGQCGQRIHAARVVSHWKQRLESLQTSLHRGQSFRELMCVAELVTDMQIKQGFACTRTAQWEHLVLLIVWHVLRKVRCPLCCALCCKNCTWKSAQKPRCLQNCAITKGPWLEASACVCCVNPEPMHSMSRLQGPSTLQAIFIFPIWLRPGELMGCIFKCCTKGPFREHGPWSDLGLVVRYSFCTILHQNLLVQSTALRCLDGAELG